MAQPMPHRIVIGSTLRNILKLLTCISVNSELLEHIKAFGPDKSKLVWPHSLATKVTFVTSGNKNNKPVFSPEPKPIEDKIPSDNHFKTVNIISNKKIIKLDGKVDKTNNTLKTHKINAK